LTERHLEHNCQSKDVTSKHVSHSYTRGRHLLLQSSVSRGQVNSTSIQNFIELSFRVPVLAKNRTEKKADTIPERVQGKKIRHAMHV